jgi:para-aminobenzoate synthetase component I
MPLRLAKPQIVELPPLRLPFWQYFEIFRDGPHAFLLDSALESARLGRFSFLGGDPFLVFRASRVPAKEGEPFRSLADCTTSEFYDSDGVRRAEPETITRREDPIAALRGIFDDHRIDAAVEDDAVSIPFLSGVVGYFGYETGHFFEKLPERARDNLNLPDIYLMFFHCVLAHCHETGKTYLAWRCAAEHRAEDECNEFLQAMKRFEQLALTDTLGATAGLSSSEGGTAGQASSGTQPSRVEIKSHFDEVSYGRAVQTVKDHIAAGDVYQVCLTHRHESPLVGGSAWDMYKQLRRINPAPFAAFLRFPEVEIVSSSPERFLKVDASGLAESRPIKGTRPRGKTPAEDERLRNQLHDSPKDQAENVMIVDLVRNDFGRVCRYGSVRVPEFLSIEKYATVFQMVSTVEGQLAEGRDRFDLIRACFPGGSMTGAPKIEAMKVIDTLEPVTRGIYSGAIGYLDFRGAMDLSMVIRTIIVKDGRCYFHVGGGIVADSDPAAEYQETQDKAKAMTRAIDEVNSGGSFRPWAGGGLSVAGW